MFVILFIFTFKKLHYLLLFLLDTNKKHNLKKICRPWIYPKYVIDKRESNDVGLNFVHIKQSETITIFTAA